MKQEKYSQRENDQRTVGSNSLKINIYDTQSKEKMSVSEEWK